MAISLGVYPIFRHTQIYASYLNWLRDISLGAPDKGGCDDPAGYPVFGAHSFEATLVNAFENDKDWGDSNRCSMG